MLLKCLRFWDCNLIRDSPFWIFLGVRFVICFLHWLRTVLRFSCHDDNRTSFQLWMYICVVIRYVNGIMLLCKTLRTTNQFMEIILYKWFTAKKDYINIKSLKEIVSLILLSVLSSTTCFKVLIETWTWELKKMDLT